MYSYKAKKLIYSGDSKSDKCLPLGGIGTGFINLNSNGSLSNLKINNTSGSKIFNLTSLFAIKAELDGKILDLRTLKTSLNEENTENKQEYFSCFHDSDFVVSYPFGEIDYSCDKFPGKIHFSAWNPLIPLNDTDSGIPAAFFEYEITNTNESEITYTLYGVTENPFRYSCNKYFETRNDTIKYIKLSTADTELHEGKKGELCIGIYGGNVRYQEYLSRCNTIEELYRDIRAGELYNRTYEPSENYRDMCVISSKVSLKQNETKKIRFVISWYFPYISDSLTSSLLGEQSDEYNSDFHLNNSYTLYNKTFPKNYYTRYFTGADECAYYCLSQWNRLYKETDEYRQLLFSSTFPYDVKSAVSTDVSNFRSGTILRNYDGILFLNNAEGNLIVTDNVELLLHLFPNVVKQSLEAFWDKFINSEKSSEETVSNIHLLYRYFKLCANTDWLLGIWDKVVIAIEFILKSSDNTCAAEISEAAYELSMAVKDKRSTKLFSELYKEYKENDFTAKCDSISSGYSIIGTLCGLEIDVYNKSFKVCPNMQFADRGVFRSILCFENFLGFIERGIDYIQFYCVKGYTYIRKIETPLTPLKIKCAEIEIGFTRGGNVATLDNDCEVSPGRSLLVIIPVEKK